MPYHDPLFECRPSVVKVGRPVRVAIIPEGSCRFFKEDKTYEVWVGGMRDDMRDYHDPLIPNVKCEVKDGYLWFDFTFEREMEYNVRFREKDGAYTKLYMYALREDLYGLRPLKGDLHSHSYYSDGTDDVAMTAACYREQGFDFYALTDHNRYYTSEMVQQAYQDVKLGLNILNGEEVHTPGTSVHIVHIGGTESIANRYIRDGKQVDKEIAEIAQTLPDVDEQYRSRLAMAVWVAREVHKVGGIVIFPHPFWISRIYNVSEDLCNILFDAGIFDAFEVMGGIPGDGNNLQVALWQEQWMKGNKITPVGSSDSHIHAFMEKQFGRSFTVAFAKENTQQGILEAVKNGWCVAGELETANPEEARFYGEYRLVAFAHFLFKHYFPRTQHLMAGEGSMMRRYIREELDGELLSALAGESEKFYKQFYGLTPVKPVSEKRMDFYRRWRKVQMEEGPKTNGTCLHFYNNGQNKARD